MAALYNPSTELHSYAAQRMSQSYDSTLPPAPPPKPNSQEVSRQSTPAAGHFSFQPPPLLSEQRGNFLVTEESYLYQNQAKIRDAAPTLEDPGDRWLPKLLEDKLKQDLVKLVDNPELLSSLAHSQTTSHPSTLSSQKPLLEALAENISLASHLIELEVRLVHLRTSTQAQLLSTHSLERQWRQKQSEMDRALSPFSLSSLYQRLNQGVLEQEMVCRALEESFLEGDSDVATEREITEWMKRYRDAKRLYYSRKEQKERWDEGRVGGWR